MNDPENTLRLTPTADGSKTVLHTGLNQTYHSLNGAVQEARHVFLQNGLQYYLQHNGESKENGSDTVARILEIGFGTGLNFLVTADWCIEHNIGLDYTGIEPFRVPTEILKNSAYQNLVEESWLWDNFLALYSGSFKTKRNRPQNRVPKKFFHLQLHFTTILNVVAFPPANIVYFDAFAPATQPEMWTPEVITHAVSSLEPGGVFVSYSVTGNLKRILKSLGFKVEKPEGAAGKREMIRAIKQ